MWEQEKKTQMIKIGSARKRTKKKRKRHYEHMNLTAQMDEIEGR
jgi:hypothetical protein